MTNIRMAKMRPTTPTRSFQELRHLNLEVVSDFGFALQVSRTRLRISDFPV
jgi:hypothetical protein